MAMKLTDAEKLADSQLRSFNRQLEKAIRTLGETHTVTQNLISTARSIFGDKGTKYMIDKTTGQAILQVSRTRTALKNATEIRIQYDAKTGKNKKMSDLDKLNKELFYNDATNQKRYRQMYDVSKTLSVATGKLRMELQSNLPNEVLEKLNKATTIADKNKIITDYVNKNATQERVKKYLKLDEIMGDIFEKYHQAIEDNEDLPPDQQEDIQYLKSLAEDYNQSRGAKDPDKILNDAIVQKTVIQNQLKQQRSESKLSIGTLEDLDSIL